MGVPQQIEEVPLHPQCTESFVTNGDILGRIISWQPLGRVVEGAGQGRDRLGRLPPWPGLRERVPVQAAGSGQVVDEAAGRREEGVAVGPGGVFVTCVPTRGWAVASGTVPASCVPHRPLCRQPTKEGSGG